MSRLRWAIALGLNHRAGTCWTDLALWAQHGRPWRNLRTLARKRNCAAVEVDGACYCGKKAGGR